MTSYGQTVKVQIAKPTPLGWTRPLGDLLIRSPTRLALRPYVVKLRDHPECRDLI